MSSGRTSAFVVALLLVGAPAIWGQVMFASDPTPRVTVAGIGEVEAFPDTASVTLGVYVLDADLRRAKTAADGSVSRLLEVTQELAVEAQDISSSVLNIEPTYSDEDKPAFLGYGVSRSVTVTLRDLAKLDELIDRAIDAGANRQFNVALSSSRIRELQDRALGLAMDDAKAQANRLATGFGAKLGAVRQIGPNPSRNTMRQASGAIVHFGSGTFAPGSLTVSSEISVTFLLEQEGIPAPDRP